MGRRLPPDGILLPGFHLDPLVISDLTLHSQNTRNRNRPIVVALLGSKGGRRGFALQIVAERLCHTLTLDHTSALHAGMGTHREGECGISLWSPSSSRIGRIAFSEEHCCEPTPHQGILQGKAPFWRIRSRLEISAVWSDSLRYWGPMTCCVELKRDSVAAFGRGRFTAALE
jgi:hypothetical protein